MDLDQAFKMAVKKFYDGHKFDNYEKATGSKLKYNKDSFDEIEKMVRKKVDKLSKEREDILDV